MNALTRKLAARYGADPALALPSLSAAASGVLEHLLDHRSVRAYTSDPLPEGTLETLVAAAQSAATSSNLQTWSVVAVRDADRRARLSVCANNQAHIRQAPLFLAWLADLSRLDRVATARGEKADANRYFEMFLVAAIDAALAAQNAVLAAEALGLGTVYIGALRNQPEEVARELGLPPHVFPVFGMCVGHVDTSRPAADIKPRLQQSVIVHQERYTTAGEAAAVEDYNGHMRAFQRSQGMAEIDWSEQSSQRVAGPQSLSGRDRLVQALRALGFENL